MLWKHLIVLSPNKVQANWPSPSFFQGKWLWAFQKNSARLSPAQGSHPTNFPLWSRQRVSHTSGLCVRGTLMAVLVPGDTTGQCCLCPQQQSLSPPLLSGHTAAEELPSHSSEELLLCCGGIIISFHLHLSYSSVFWYTGSIWKWTKKQECGQNFQSLIFILCQNRIPDWSNIVFWLMCFRKLVADPDWEWSLLVDDSAGENIAKIVFLLIIWNMPR